PALVRHVRSRKGWEGAFLEPLLIWPQDPDAADLGFLPEPLINTRALESLTASENVLEEAARLADDLGLEDSEPLPLDELVARLRDLTARVGVEGGTCSRQVPRMWRTSENHRKWNLQCRRRRDGGPVALHGRTGARTH